MLRAMWQLTRAQWWALLAIAVLLVAAWPPADDRSLLINFVNWAVDPGDRLPTLPGPLALGEGDDPAIVDAHDLQTRMYDELPAKGGWTRLRLQLKVARDPLAPYPERHLLVIAGVIATFAILRTGSSNPKAQIRKPKPQG
jgi:hypothetical protein